MSSFLYITQIYIFLLYLDFVWCKMVSNIETIFDQIPAHVVNGRSSSCFINSALQSSLNARAAFLELVLKLIIKGRHLLSSAGGPPLRLLLGFPWERVSLQKIIFMVSQSRELNTSQLISLEHQYHLNVGFGTF